MIEKSSESKYCLKKDASAKKQSVDSILAESNE